jgi:hypothetical protein
MTRHEKLNPTPTAANAVVFFIGMILFPDFETLIPEPE